MFSHAIMLALCSPVPPPLSRLHYGKLSETRQILNLGAKIGRFVKILGLYIQTEKGLRLGNKYHTYLLFRKASGAIRKSGKSY